MKTKLFVFFVFVSVFSVQTFAQNSQSIPVNQLPIQTPISIENIAVELTNVSKSLQTFNKNFKAFLDKLPQGTQFSEKQQNLLLSFEILNRAEQRLEILQKFQIELTEKQGDLKNRLTQVEQNMTPQGIESGVAFLGTTQTPEIKENRRRTLEAERNSLRQVLLQINQNLADTAGELSDASTFVKRLRNRILPQIEREVSNLQ